MEKFIADRESLINRILKQNELFVQKTSLMTFLEFYYIDIESFYLSFQI